MKIYTMSSESNELLFSEGLVISERYRKNKETGEKKFYPIGTYSIDKARSQYFFLSKSLQEMVIDDHLNKIDNIVFKQHNNVPELLIAFPDRKDTVGFLIFTGYKKDDIMIIDDEEVEERVCPYCNIPSKHYHLNMYNESDLNYYCDYCNAIGEVPKTEDEAMSYAAKAGIDKQIKASTLVGKFIHTTQNAVHIGHKANVELENFLDVFAVKIPNGSTIRFLLNKTFMVQDTPQAAQYLVEFTYNFNSKPKVKITKVPQPRFTVKQYALLLNKANEYKDYLIHIGPNESTLAFSFPDTYDEKEAGPFSVLEGIVPKEEDNEPNE